MLPAVIADRFVRTTSGEWLDLSTGWTVAIDAAPLDDESSGRLPEAAHARPADPCLVDWGSIDRDHRFSARLRSPWGWTPSLDAEGRALAERIAARRGPGVHFEPVSAGGDPTPLVAVLARHLRAHGCVLLRPAVSPFPGVPQEYRHRHTVLVIAAADDPRPLLRWMHALASASARTHVVLDARLGIDSSGARCTVLARDRVSRPWPADRVVTANRAAEWLQRAHRAASRRRRTEAVRAARAAVESARRHGHPAGVVRAARLLVDLHAAREEWEEACRIARRAVEHLQGSPEWTAAAAMLSSHWIGAGSLDAAEALLTTAMSQAAVLAAPPERAVMMQLGWLRFWQGRFEEVEAVAGRLASAPDAAILDGLAGWARGDARRLRGAAERLAGAEAPAPSVLWSHTFTALANGLFPGEADAVRRAAQSIASASAASSEVATRRLVHLLAADLLVSVGDVDGARQVLGPDAHWRRAPRLMFWLRAWLTAEAAARPQAVVADVRRAGAVGFDRWGVRRDTMRLAHVVPAVLEMVEHAEDEHTALTRCCHWLRRTTEAAGVAVLAADDLARIAADGWTAQDTLAAGLTPAIIGDRSVVLAGGDLLVTVPIRTAGTLLGWLVARGPTGRGDTLRDLGRVLAVIAAPALHARLEALALARRSAGLTPEILGISPATVSLREAIARAAATPFPVLIEGESGTGKELVARAIHRLSARRDRRILAVNCAALTDELVEAELFGHARGAFTGALNVRLGLFEDANGGTVFLDEVAELSPRAQAKLLRVLQEREIRRVGENVPRPIDIRVIAATNQPLGAAALRGAFRSDLLFRLAVVTVRLTPLRDRPEDVPILARAFWQRLTREANRAVRLGPDALEALARHDWPGNVRECQNVMAALLVSAPARGRVTARHVHQVIAAPVEPPAAVPLARLRHDVECRAIRMALARHGGRRAPAARDLGLSRQGLVKAIRRLKLAGSDAEAEGVA